MNDPPARPKIAARMTDDWAIFRGDDLFPPARTQDHPESEADATLLAHVNRGEFLLNGFRNRDLRQLLFPTPAGDEAKEKRRSGRDHIPLAMVTTTESMVAILGWIMPLPLANPPSRTGWPSAAMTSNLWPSSITRNVAASPAKAPPSGWP